MPLWAQLSAMILDGFFYLEVEVLDLGLFEKYLFKASIIKAFLGGS
jgi:hypothetical protein